MFTNQRTFGAAILRATDDAAGSGAFSVDDAAAAVMALGADPGPEPEEQPAAEAETDAAAGDAVEAEQESEAEPQTAEGAEAEEAEAEPETEDAEGEQPQPLDPPPFWAADDKAAFADLPRPLQEKVLAYEKNRDAATSKAIQEATEARNQTDQVREAAQKRAAELDAVIAKANDAAEAAERTFASKWPDVIDWPGTLRDLTERYTEALGPERGPSEATNQYLLLKEQHEADQRQLQGLQAAKQEAAEKAAREAKENEAAAYTAFLETERTKLATVAPELADPKHGPDRLKAVATYLVGAGVTVDQLRHAGASELSIAYKAMRFDEMEAKAKAASSAPRPQARPNPQPQRSPTVRPSAAAEAVPPAKRQALQLQERFNRTNSIEDAQALILARQGSR